MLKTSKPADGLLIACICIFVILGNNTPFWVEFT